MALYVYKRWDGTQSVFDPDADDILDELSKGVLEHGDIERALRELMRRGMRSPTGDRMEGFRGLMERLKQRRQDFLQRHNLDSIVEDLKKRLDQILQTERLGIEKRLQQARDQAAQAQGEEAQQQEQLMKMLEQRAQQKQQFLDNLPQSLGGAIKELTNYEFMDPEAQAQFQELLKMLQGQMLNSMFQNMRQSLQNLTPQDMAAIKEMVKALNQMLRQRAKGEEPDFQGFMDQFGQMFGQNPPQSLDELLQRIAEGSGQLQSLLESMSPEMRQELEDIMGSVMDRETEAELMELAAHLEYLMPMEDLRKDYPFAGDESTTLEEAMRMMRQLQGLDDLEEKLKDLAASRGNVDLEDIDPDKVEELLGTEARRHLETLRRMAKRLEEAGYLRRKGNKLELTPRGMRKIGQKALKDIFSQLKKDRVGRHEIFVRGAGGDWTGETKEYEFGDPMDIELERTILNAVQREGSGVPVRLHPKDFEIRRREYTTQAATVLLLDQSRSMGLMDSFPAAKKVALALHHLIQSQFPTDYFYVIGFSDYANEISRDHLAEVTWNAWVSGTNMHHAFMLSRKLLNKHKGASRQIIMVTDGEPTAHLEGGRAYFSYPPSYKTIQETLKEVKLCTREGIVINTFMLETTRYLLDFVDRLTKINKGRAFYTTPDKLGEYIMVDYLRNRRKHIRD